MSCPWSSQFVRRGTVIRDALGGAVPEIFGDQSFDHLVGAGEQRVGHGKALRLGGIEFDNRLVFGRRLHW